MNDADRMRMLTKMYRIVKLKKGKLHKALRIMGKRNLKGSELKAMWSENCPTIGYCYVVSEYVHHFCMKKRTLPFVIKDVTSGGTHWFLKTEKNEIIDLTLDQRKKAYPYKKGRRQKFRTANPSKRTLLLAKLMGKRNKSNRG